MTKREKQRIEKLNTKKARRALSVTANDVFEVMKKISDARKQGFKTVRIPKSTDKMREELESRDFEINDTGLVWHISW